jgi:hypothetical protein
METPITPRPVRRLRFRLSIRMLMISVLVIGGGFGWVVHRAMVQRVAVGAVLKAGGSVYYDWQLLGDGRPNPTGTLRWPSWMVKRLGVDYFGTVRQAFLINRDLDRDLDAAQLGRLEWIERLYLTGPGVTDQHLAHIEGMTKLRGLDLEGSQVSDEGLRYLLRMKSLEAVNFKGTRVTDAGVERLKLALPGLKHTSK